MPSEQALDPPPARASTLFKCALLVLALVAGGLSAALVVHDGLRSRVLETLAIIGGAYRASYEAGVPPEAGARSSEYLVVLVDGARPEDYLAYLETRPGVRFLSESVYPSTIRVAVPVPVGEHLKALQAQPFARFVVRNLPIFFCH